MLGECCGVLAEAADVLEPFSLAFKEQSGAKECQQERALEEALRVLSRDVELAETREKELGRSFHRCVDLRRSAYGG